MGNFASGGGSTGQYLAAGGGLLQAGGDIFDGYARASELKMQAKAAEIQGKQDQTSRLVDLQRTLGAITALTAQRGVNVDSPSAQAYDAGVSQEAYRNINRTRENATLQSSALRRSASNALFSGYLKAGSDLEKAAEQAAMMAAGA